MQSIEFNEIRVCDRAGGRQENESTIALLVIVGQCIDLAIQRLEIESELRMMWWLPKCNWAACTKADQKKTNHESHL